jgi:ABC-type transport system involved in multi-copper enzyme maturation permease subunit
VPDDQTNSIPGGVRAIAIIFAGCSLYLALVAAIMLISPGTLSMAVGAPLLFGLELSGPYMFLLVAGVAGGIALGLLKRINIVRHAATLAALTGVVMLVPSVSAATVMVQFRPLVFGGIGIIVRIVIAWYLSQEPTAAAFRRL